MRFASLIPAALVLSLSSAAFAQAEWIEFVDRADHFIVNFPGEPDVEDLQYKTAKGMALPAHIYSAQDRRGQYVLTVVDYRNASPEEVTTAIEGASNSFRAKGKVTYDESGWLYGHDSQRITAETPEGRRWLAEILMSTDKRLYITEASSALDAPPPAAYAVSLQILDDDGELIIYTNGGQKSGERRALPGN